MITALSSIKSHVDTEVGQVEEVGAGQYTYQQPSEALSEQGISGGSDAYYSGEEEDGSQRLKQGHYLHDDSSTWW